MASYDHQSIEKKWQQRWEDTGANKAVESSTKPKRYVLDMFPYPSGAGLHVGHPIGYIATDIISRTWRMQGFNVLHPMGWDAFGLPAENFAIKTGVHPAVSTKQNIDNFRRQMKMLGLSYDWSREISTCDPAYYKWTQWMFLELYKNGLAYKKKAPVNWCEKDQTVLANEQVVDGCCERCGTPVVQKELSQWFFGITKYADRLLAGLDKLDWPEKIKAMQKNWIGKSAGAEISFGLPAGKELVVFTTRPDTLMGVSYVVLSPEHALVDELTIPAQKKDMDVYRLAAKGKSELERTQLEKDKSGVFTGSFATHPITGEPIPVWVSDYVFDKLWNRRRDGRSSAR
jgi:leucyl-tRNA synthetase